jgi:hypothetical protein
LLSAADAFNQRNARRDVISTMPTSLSKMLDCVFARQQQLLQLSAAGS